MSYCYLNHSLENRKASDSAFSGATHALSAAAIFLSVTAFFPHEVYKALGASSIWIILLAAINVAGSSLTPDLDNTASTSKSSLGFLGEALSFIFRSISVIVQTTVRTSRDDPDPNPHRGLFHTIVMSIAMGALIYFGTILNPFSFSLPIIGKLNSGAFFALIISWLNLHMALAGLAKELVKKIKNLGGVFGELLAFVFSLSIVVLLFTQIPKNTSFQWLGVSVTVGMLIHLLGDTFTKAGCPLMWPIPHKGKMWWTYRIVGITSGGAAEHFLFIPFFLFLIIASFAKIFLSL